MTETSNQTRPAMDWLVLLGFCGFLFFFGLSYFGLIGADEPRYAQVAREMLARHDWISPTLGGKPWLEKPVLYYWEAMLAYSVFGVSDWAARLPSALNATGMVVGIYCFLRRFRPGFHLDGALMTASAAGIIGFARAASMDMLLAATFTLAMLAWYAWYDSGKYRYLLAFYGCLAVAAPAKGPVAMLLATLIIVAFVMAKRDYRVLVRTLWTPGIVAFLLIVSPWYLLVQIRNPEFFRVFILENNLSRFGTDRYHHTQPFWYYLPVILLGLVPWVVFAAAAVWEIVRGWFKAGREMLHAENAFRVFLLIWLLAFLIFFSLSHSKLPGYIIPALPAATILLAEYLRRHASSESRPPLAVAVPHALVAASLVVPALAIQYIVLQHRLPGGRPALVSGALAALMAAGIAVTLRLAPGFKVLRFVTLVPVILTMAVVLRVGSPALDAKLSARPVAAELKRIDDGGLPAAVFQAKRETEYGLHFYRDQPILRYERGEIPAGQHIVVAPHGTQERVAAQVAGRRVSYLGGYPPQDLDFFWVSAAGAPAGHMH